MAARDEGARGAVSRRTWLTAAGTVLLAGCAASQPTRQQLLNAPSTLVIADEYLSRAEHSLSAAWKSDHPSGTLTFVSVISYAGPNRPGPMVNQSSVAANMLRTHGADVVGVSDGDGLLTELLDLGPYVGTANLNLAALIPASVGAFTIGGRLRAVPLFPTQVQFYVNTPALKTFGIPVRSVWTWDDFESALRSVVPGGGHLPYGALPVAGLTWADFRMWGALVEGLGGTLISGDQLNVAGAFEATLKLVSFARAVGWDPGSTRSSALATFYPGGFQGKAAQSPFAFSAPWTVAFTGGNVNSLWGPKPPNVVQGLPVSAFPQTPIRRVTPAFHMYGVGELPSSKRIETATSFLFWLLQPAQQVLLMDAGLPPVTTDAATLTYWRALRQAANVPVCDESALLDVPHALPPVRASGTSSGLVYQRVIGAALAHMYHGASVEAELGRAQRLLAAAR